MSQRGFVVLCGVVTIAIGAFVGTWANRQGLECIRQMRIGVDCAGVGEGAVWIGRGILVIGILAIIYAAFVMPKRQDV